MPIPPLLWAQFIAVLVILRYVVIGALVFQDDTLWLFQFAFPLTFPVPGLCPLCGECCELDSSKGDEV